MGSIFSALSRLHLRPRYPFLTLSPRPVDPPPAGAARLATGTLPADPAVGRPAGESESEGEGFGGGQRERGRSTNPRPRVARSSLRARLKNQNAPSNH